jgi:dihydrofolate reductase
MRKLVVSEFVSLDGIMEDPGGAEKYEHGGWARPYWSDGIGKIKYEELFAADTMLLGRITYQGFAAAWPTVKDDAGFADRMNGLPKYVVTMTLDKLEWNNSRVLKGDLAEEITKLKQQSGQDILVAGSATLIGTLLQHNLIDEYRLLVYPVVLGSGKRLFKDPNQTAKLKLLESEAFPSGVVYLHYGASKE